MPALNPEPLHPKPETPKPPVLTPTKGLVNRVVPRVALFQEAAVERIRELSSSNASLGLGLRV